MEAKFIKSHGNIHFPNIMFDGCCETRKVHSDSFILNSSLIPIIYLKGDQYPDHHQQYLPNRIQQVFAELACPTGLVRRVVGEESLTDLSEEGDHTNNKGLSKLWSGLIKGNDLCQSGINGALPGE